MKIWLLIFAASLISAEQLKNVFTVKTNETVSLKCPVNSPIDYSDDLYEDNDYTEKYAKRTNKMLIVQWFKDSHRLRKLTLPLRYSLNNANNADLDIQNVRASDAGHYSCKVIGGYGSAVHEFRLVVREDNVKGVESRVLKRVKPQVNKKFMPPFFTNPESMVIRSYMKSVGSFIQFSCDSDGVPRPDVLWFKNGEVLSEEDYGITRSKWKLDLKDIRKADTGNYTCQVFNKIGYINATYALSVYEDLGPQQQQPPQLFDSLEQPSYINTTIIADMDAILECVFKYSASDLPQVKWMKQITRSEYDNYILQNNVNSADILNPASILNNNDELKNFYQTNTNTKAPLYWSENLPEDKLDASPSSFYSLNDLIGAKNLNNQLDNLKLEDLMGVSKNKRSVGNDKVHYITLTASASTHQTIKFNRQAGTYTSQLKINRANVNDSGVYVCFLNGQSHGKSYLNVLPNNFVPIRKQETYLETTIVPYSVKSNIKSLGILIILVPILFITAFAIASICYLKNLSSQRNNRRLTNKKTNRGLFSCISKPALSDVESANRKGYIPANAEITMYNQNSQNNKSCTDTNGKTENTSFSDTSSTTATTLPYYATVPLLNNNSPPPPLPNSQPPAYYKDSTEKSGLERCESTPSMAYYKIVENEISCPPTDQSTPLPVGCDETGTCVSSGGHSRVYYQLTPNYTQRYGNQPNYNSNYYL